MGIKKKNRDMEEYDEIEKELKKKYDAIVVPDKMFDTTKMWERIAEEQKKRKS